MCMDSAQLGNIRAAFICEDKQCHVGLTWSRERGSSSLDFPGVAVKFQSLVFAKHTSSYVGHPRHWYLEPVSRDCLEPPLLLALFCSPSFLAVTCQYVHRGAACRFAAMACPDPENRSSICFLLRRDHFQGSRDSIFGCIKGIPGTFACGVLSWTGYHKRCSEPRRCLEKDWWANRQGHRFCRL